MSPLDSLLSKLVQEDSLGLLLALHQQLIDKLPVGLGDGGRTRVEQGNLLLRTRKKTTMKCFPQIRKKIAALSALSKSKFTFGGY